MRLKSLLLIILLLPATSTRGQLFKRLIEPNNAIFGINSSNLSGPDLPDMYARTGFNVGVSNNFFFGFFEPSWEAIFSFKRYEQGHDYLSSTNYTNGNFIDPYTHLVLPIEDLMMASVQLGGSARINLSSSPSLLPYLSCGYMLEFNIGHGTLIVQKHTTSGMMYYDSFNLGGIRSRVGNIFYGVGFKVLGSATKGIRLELRQYLGIGTYYEENVPEYVELWGRGGKPLRENKLILNRQITLNIIYGDYAIQ